MSRINDITENTELEDKEIGKDVFLVSRSELMRRTGLKKHEAYHPRLVAQVPINAKGAVKVNLPILLRYIEMGRPIIEE